MMRFEEVSTCLVVVDQRSVQRRKGQRQGGGKGALRKLHLLLVETVVVVLRPALHYTPQPPLPLWDTAARAVLDLLPELEHDLGVHVRVRETAVLPVGASVGRPVAADVPPTVTRPLTTADLDALRRGELERGRAETGELRLRGDRRPRVRDLVGRAVRRRGRDSREVLLVVNRHARRLRLGASAGDLVAGRHHVELYLVLGRRDRVALGEDHNPDVVGVVVVVLTLLHLLLHLLAQRPHPLDLGAKHCVLLLEATDTHVVRHLTVLAAVRELVLVDQGHRGVLVPTLATQPPSLREEIRHLAFLGVLRSLKRLLDLDNPLRSDIAARRGSQSLRGDGVALRSVAVTVHPRHAERRQNALEVTVTVLPRLELSLVVMAVAEKVRHIVLLRCCFRP
eukprot:Hpha_TRINITY_DN15371_c1_g3::TRINITY_DN15371_c1_g3_i1::g.92299::m.92299